MEHWVHWSCDIDENKVVWLSLDRAGEKTNTLSSEVVVECEQVLDYIESFGAAGVVLMSAKSTGFIFGADINEFLDVKNKDDAFQLIHRTQKLLDRWESLPIPTVALVDGMCLGGGFEVALAMDYRVAVRGSQTRFALPEVKLGIQPGWGGTVRLPRLIGVAAAMPLMLSGRFLSVKRAKRLGCVDAAVPRRHARRAALDFIRRQPPKHRPHLLARLMSAGPIRGLLAGKMVKTLEAKGVNPEHYPAPYRMVSNWQDVGLSNAAYEKEAESIAELMMTPTAQQLVRVFFMQSQLKATAKGPAFAGQRVHVVGAGTMGGDIAAWCALQGYRVSLQDRTIEHIAPAIRRAAVLFKKKSASTREARLILDRLIPDPQGHGMQEADIVIEAIFEDLAAKQALFQEMEKRCKPSAILATNTSSIPLSDIAESCEKPERLVGIHFFNPVAQMQLVEVVHSDRTDSCVLQQALAFVKQIKKFPLPVKSHPGFLINRILMPYLIEAMHLFDEGVSVDTIDQAALSYGMPMGPMKLADTVGLDVCLMVAKNLLPIYGGDLPAVIASMVEAGHLGRKSGRGFYRYSGKQAVVAEHPDNEKTMPSQDVRDRLIFRQLNESVAALREEIVSSPDLLDAGMIYGTGFAPFRGGPLQAVRDKGLESVLARFAELSDQFGSRFLPDSGWSSLEQSSSEQQETLETTTS